MLLLEFCASKWNAQFLEDAVLTLSKCFQVAAVVSNFWRQCATKNNENKINIFQKIKKLIDKSKKESHNIHDVCSSVYANHVRVD